MNRWRIAARGLLGAVLMGLIAPLGLFKIVATVNGGTGRPANQLTGSTTGTLAVANEDVGPLDIKIEASGTVPAWSGTRKGRLSAVPW